MNKFSLLPRGKKLSFISPKKEDVYNITPPFISHGTTYIAGRTESRNSDFLHHHNEKVLFYTQKNNDWIVDPIAPIFQLEDPFITVIRDELIFGGVEVFMRDQKMFFKTVFYRGKNIQQLEKFAEGPENMKDIRLGELSSGLIAVFTRPMIQKRKTLIRKIGFTTIRNLHELTPPLLQTAPCIEKMFQKDMWGGVNQVHALSNGKIGLIGHNAHKDSNEHLHYSAISFIFDPKSFTATPSQIIATRADFPPGETKRVGLEDVVFSGGIIQNIKNKNMVDLYVGLSDAEAGVITIPHPFL